MELARYGDDDLWLSEALERDPGMMRELGGPADRADIARAHTRRVQDAWYFKIVPDPGGPSAGTIGIWDSEWRGERIDEVGWMVLPAFQRRGIASRALGLLIERAREDPAFERIHAFPGSGNVPSNALCRKFGFELSGECERRFRDRTLRGNHWELDLRRAGTARDEAA